MHTDRLATGTFHSTRILFYKDVLAVPADAHFYGDRLIHGFHDSRHHLVNFVRIQQPAGAGITFGHFRNRTAHINVDNIGIGLFIHHSCRSNQRFTVASKNLQAQRFLPLIHKQHFACTLVAVQDCLVTDHFCADQTCAKLFRDQTKRRIAYAGHRRQNHLVLHFNTANFQHVLSLPLLSCFI
ncbi:hypothetical protein D3C80_1432040 [compost metagenome]